MPDRETPTTTNPPPAGRPRRRRGLSVLKLMGVVVLAAAGLAALRNATEAVAGAAFLVAALALALATVGALCRPAGARAGWVGFAVLGWVYMILAFTPLLGQDTAYGELSRRPVLATVPLLELIFVKAPALRGVGSPAQDTSLATLRALAALDRPIPMPFPRETSLADILAYVRRAAAGPDLPDGLPIYVDPNGLQEQDKTMESTATIDLDGVPLRTTLSLVLRQLDLTYTVQDGLVVIYSKTDEEPPFDNPNAFQRIGHCLFALLSGILGGVAGPLVAGRRPGGDS